jgi:hypothetical protein
LQGRRPAAWDHLPSGDGPQSLRTVAPFLRNVVRLDGEFVISLQAGAGITRQLSNRTHFMSVRWFHLSKGSFFTDRNPGYDSIRAYAGFVYGY